MATTFSGMRVLITGAGTGIGKLLALRFAADGAIVLVTARRLEAAEAVADAIRKNGGEAHAYVLDVTAAETLTDLRAVLLERHGPIDVLVNNAGMVQGGPFEEVPLSDHFATVDVNLLGTMATIHTFLPDLISRPRAHVVNLSSAAGYVSLPFGTSYAATKWALVGFSDSLRLELAHRGHRNVKVTTVCPSYVDTGMFEGVRTPFGLPMLAPDALVEAIVRAAGRGQASLKLPFLLKFVELGKGILPGPLWDLYMRLTGVTTSMVSWRGKPRLPQRISEAPRPGPATVSHDR